MSTCGNVDAGPHVSKPEIIPQIPKPRIRAPGSWNNPIILLPDCCFTIFYDLLASLQLCVGRN